MAKSGRRSKKAPPTVPGRSGKVEIERVIVDDPYERGKKVEVTRNIRASGLVALYQRGRLGAADDAEARLLAGVEFQKIYERAQIGGARAIDYSAIKVDASPIYSGLPDSVAVALRRLAEIRWKIGPRYQVLESVCWQGVGIYEFAARVDGCFPSRSVTAGATSSLIEALDLLIEYFGVARGKARGQMRADRDIGLTAAAQCA